MPSEDCYNEMPVTSTQRSVFYYQVACSFQGTQPIGSTLTFSSGPDGSVGALPPELSPLLPPAILEGFEYKEETHTETFILSLPLFLFWTSCLHLPNAGITGVVLVESKAACVSGKHPTNRATSLAVMFSILVKLMYYLLFN